MGWSPVSLAVAALMVFGCSSKRDVEKPKPPDMQPLVDAYKTPTGTLDQAAFDSMKQLVLDRQSLLDSADLDQLFTSALDVALVGSADAGTDAGAAAPALPVEGDGYVTVTRICGGWGSTDVPDKANGSMRFTLTFSEKGPDPTVWGSFSACIYRALGSQVRIGEGSGGQTGRVSAYFGDSLSFSGYDGSPVLFDADMLAEVDGQPYPVDFDFRIEPATRKVELRVPVADGDVIVEVTPAGIQGMRAGNGTFTCDAASSTCTADTGVSVSL